MDKDSKIASWRQQLRLELEWDHSSLYINNKVLEGVISEHRFLFSGCGFEGLVFLAAASCWACPPMQLSLVLLSLSAGEDFRSVDSHTAESLS